MAVIEPIVVWVLPGSLCNTSGG